MESVEVENTVKQLCAIASAQQRRRHAFKRTLIKLRKFLCKHTEVLRSMSDDTFEALRRVGYY